MKFGALPDRLLAAIDFRLPPEPAFNATVLQGKPALQPKAYVGAAVWGSPSWQGKLYPAKTPAAQYRQQYPQHFNTIELNATHYAIYSPEVLQQWTAPASGKDFIFCPKFPQQISHHSGFENTKGLTTAFLHSIAALRPHLGPAFLQLSESFSPQHKEALFTYLSSLPKDMLFFLEVRHPGWFTTTEEENLFTTLHHLGIGAVITDTPGRRDAAHMHLTLPKLFLRFVCNGVHPSTFTRINQWIDRIQQWLERGLEELYVIVHPGNDAAVPDVAAHWTQQLNTHCGFQLHLGMQPQLF